VRLRFEWLVVLTPDSEHTTSLEARTVAYEYRYGINTAVHVNFLSSCPGKSFSIPSADLHGGLSKVTVAYTGDSVHSILPGDSVHGICTRQELSLKPRLSSPLHISEDCLAKVRAEKIMDRPECITEECLIKMTTRHMKGTGIR